MPIYEYQCRKCGAHHELLQRMSDPPLRRCPSCRGLVEKLVSRSSFQLKGNGWYVTDYARRGSGTKPDRSTDKSEQASADAQPAQSAA